VLDGDPAPLPQKGGGPPSPIFGQFLLWPNGWMHPDATWYGCRPQPRQLCVRWGPSLPPLKAVGGQFSARIDCGQTTAWIKMAFVIEVGLCGPGHIVLDGDPAPLPKRGRAPQNFRPISIVAKRLDTSRCHLVSIASAQVTLS